MLKKNTGRTANIMAEVKVTKQFKDNFDIWANFVVDRGEWSQEEIEGFKQLLREYELADGPDRLRDDLVHYTPEGTEKPSAINDPKERYRYWDRFFAQKAAEISVLFMRKAA
jgi:hypothetical protein